MKRIFFLVVVLVTVVSVVAMTASAASYDLIDYNDYVTNVSVDGSNDLVYVRFPAELCQIKLQTTTGWQFLYDVTGGQLNVSNLPTQTFYLYIVPLGAFGRLDLSYIPDDTLVKSYYTVSSSGGITGTPDVLSIEEYFVDETVDHDSASIIGQVYDSFSYNSSNETSWYVDGEGANNMLFYMRIGPFTLPSHSLSVNFEYFEMEMTISSLLRQQQLTGKTNELLEDIAGYVPEVNTPEGGEVIGDVGSVEDELMNDVQGGIDEIENSTSSAIGTLSRYATALYCVSWILNQLFTISWVTDLLYVSMGLGVLIVLFNISLTAIAKSGKQSGKSKGG